jgi:hypothetical protein
VPSHVLKRKSVAGIHEGIQESPSAAKAETHPGKYPITDAGLVSESLMCAPRMEQADGGAATEYGRRRQTAELCLAAAPARVIRSSGTHSARGGGAGGF